MILFLVLMLHDITNSFISSRPMLWESLLGLYVTFIIFSHSFQTSVIIYPYMYVLSDLCHAHETKLFSQDEKCHDMSRNDKMLSKTGYIYV